MCVMIIITLVITVNLLNISSVNILYRKTFRFLKRMGTGSPPIKTSSAIQCLCFFILVKKQCLNTGITFNVALIHPMES